MGVLDDIMGKDPAMTTVVDEEGYEDIGEDDDEYDEDIVPIVQPVKGLMFKPVSALPKRQTNLVGREGIRWEDQLAALKSAPGEFYIIFEYNYTTDEEGARKTNLCGSKAGSIRRRLDSHDPDADWEILVRRDVPNNHVGIYAKYIGEMTEEKRSVKAERRAKYAERSRAAKQANRNQDEQDD